MADLPINYGDSWKVARDKINDSFNELAATVEWYKPQIINWVWWIWTTNTGVKAEWDSIVMKVEDWYIWYKSESNSWTKIIAVADLKWSQWNPWADWNWIASITSTKVGKTTTVTITETGGTVDTFQIQDWADWVWWDWDVKWPDSSTNWHMAVFDWATWKIIRDWGSVPTWFAPWNAWTTGQVLKKTNSWYEWDDESGWGGSWDVVVSTDTGNELSTGVALWFWTESDYSSISTPDTNTLYIQYKSDWGGGWKPWVNTVAYFPFDTDFKDYSWNWHDLTNNWWVAIESVDWITCANFKDQSPYWLSRIDWSIITSWPYTYLAWLNMDSSSWTENPRMFAWKDNWFIIWNRERGGWIYPGYWSNTWVPYSAWWHLVCIVGDSSNGSYESYKDWVYLNSWTWTTGGRTWLVLWTNEGNFSSALDKFIGQMSRVIFENKKRTAQEIADYYDLTKWDYWIS